MENITNEKEENKIKEQISDKRGIIAIAAIGIGVSIYGYVKGRVDGHNYGFKKGYSQGTKDGIIYMNNQIFKAVTNLAEAGKEFKEGS